MHAQRDSSCLAEIVLMSRAQAPRKSCTSMDTVPARGTSDRASDRPNRVQSFPIV
jgi:hypothetical protein